MIKRVISNERRLCRKSANFWALAYRIPSDQVAARKPTVNSSVVGQVANSLERDGRIWHREVITEAVEGTLLDLQRMSALTNFYIAGGKNIFDESWIKGAQSSPIQGSEGADDHETHDYH